MSEVDILKTMSDEDAKDYRESEIADYWVTYDKSNPI